MPFIISLEEVKTIFTYSVVIEDNRFVPVEYPTQQVNPGNIQHKKEE